MAANPSSTWRNTKDPPKESTSKIYQENLKNDGGGNIVAVNQGTLIGAQKIINIALQTADGLADVLGQFTPKAEATSQILIEIALKTKGISKTLTDISELVQGEEAGALSKGKTGNDRGIGEDGDDVKVTKLPGFVKLVEACKECSSVLESISEEINRPSAENLPYETVHYFELQIDEQQRSLQMNLQLFHIYVDKNYSTEMREFIFELAISFRAVVMRLAEIPTPQQAPPYTQAGPQAQISGPLLGPRSINFPDFSSLIPLYIGWKIRKAKPSDFPAHSRFALSHTPSWTRIVCSPMPFSSDELFLMVLAQISRRAKRNCTLQDEYKGLRSGSQRRQVARLIKDKNQELPEGMEWRLAGLESVVRNMGLWKKETRRIKVILKIQWVPGVGGKREGGEGEGGGGGVRPGSRNDGGGASGSHRAGRVPQDPDGGGGGGDIFQPQQYPERPLSARVERTPVAAYQDGQNFREQERGYVRARSRHSHSRSHQTPPPTLDTLPQAIRVPHRRRLHIGDAPSQTPHAPEHINRHRRPPQPPPQNIRLPASQSFIYLSSRSPSPPPPPVHIHTPYVAPPGMPRFESQESALHRVISEVTPELEELVVDSLFAEWDLPPRDRKGKGREDFRRRNISYGRDWASGRDIPRRTSYLGREYNFENSYEYKPRSSHSPRRTPYPGRGYSFGDSYEYSPGSSRFPRRTSYPGREYTFEDSYDHGPSRPSGHDFHVRPNFNSRSSFSESDRYRRGYTSDPGLGSGYSSHGDYEGGDSSRRRVRRYRRDSTYPSEPMRYPAPPPRPVIRSVLREPRPVISYSGRDQYAEAPSRYEEKWAEERVRRPRRAREVDELARPYTERTVTIFRGADPFAPLSGVYQSEADDSVDEEITMRRGGGTIRREPRRQSRRDRSIYSEEGRRERPDRDLVLRSEPLIGQREWDRVPRNFRRARRYEVEREQSTAAALAMPRFL